MNSSKTFALVAVCAALVGCGGGDDVEHDPPEAGGGGTAPSAQTETGTTTAPPASEPPAAVEPRDGENLHVNDIADCLLEAGVGAAPSLDGAAIDLHDAQSQVIVEQGNGDVLVYADADAAEAAEPGYRDSFGNLSEVGRVRNVLWQTDPDIASEARSKLKACLGV